MATIVLAYKYGSFAADSTLTIGTDISASDAGALVGNGEARWGTAGPLSSSGDVLPLWTANTVYPAQTEILDPTGATILVRKTTGTSRSTYDTTEQALWSAAGASGASLPSQTGNAGKYLTTDGSAAAWGTVATGLTPTAVKTANYTAAAGDFVPVDTTSGNVTVTLPTAPADKAQLAIKHVVRGGTNTVTIAAGGTDRFNVAGGTTTATLSVLREAATFQYQASSGLWYALSNDLPLSQLTPAAIGAEPVHTSGTLAARPSATGSKVLYTATDDNGGTTYFDSASGTWTKTGGPVTPVGLGGPSYNFAPTNFKKWRKALSQVRNGGAAYAKVLMIGDSTAWGVGSGATPLSFGSWPYRLMQLLNSYYVPAQIGLNIAQGNTPQTDSRWTLGTGWAYQKDNAAGWGGANVRASSGAAGNCVFAPGYLCDTADFWYLDNGQGSLTVTVDTGESTTLNGSGSTGWKKTTLTFAAGSAKTFTLAGPSGGSFYLFGIDAYSSVSKNVRVALSGVGTSSAADWADNSTAYKSRGGITAYAPDLSIIMLGINDANAGTSSATWQTNVTTLITTAQASGDVILASVVPSGSSGLTNGATGVALEVAYAAAAQTLAATNNCGFIDINSRFVDYATANTATYMSDFLHPTGFGYADIAQAIFNALRTI